MSDIKEQSIVEIENRILNAKSLIGLKAFYRNNDILISKENVPCVKLIEGNDEIKEYSSRGNAGYPARRLLEIDVQIISIDQNDRGASIKNLFLIVRRAIFCVKVDGAYVPTPSLARNSYIREIRSVGPLPYETQGLIGIVLTIGLNYVDDKLINF